MLKKYILVCTLFFVLFSFTACGKEELIEPDVATIMTAIDSQISFPEMVDIALDRVDDYYEVDVSTIDDVKLIMAGSGASPEEILVIKFQEAEQAKTFEDKMNNRFKQISNLFSNYGTPESADYIENCKIEVKNQYAFFAICENSDVALQIFNDAFTS